MTNIIHNDNDYLIEEGNKTFLWAVSSYLKSVQFFIKTIIVIIKNVYFSDVLYLRIPFNFALKTFKYLEEHEKSRLKNVNYSKSFFFNKLIKHL